MKSFVMREWGFLVIIIDMFLGIKVISRGRGPLIGFAMVFTLVGKKIESRFRRNYFKWHFLWYYSPSRRGEARATRTRVITRPVQVKAISWSSASLPMTASTRMSLPQNNARSTDEGGKTFELFSLHRTFNLTISLRQCSMCLHRVQVRAETNCDQKYLHLRAVCRTTSILKTWIVSFSMNKCIFVVENGHIENYGSNHSCECLGCIRSVKTMISNDLKWNKLNSFNALSIAPKGFRLKISSKRKIDNIYENSDSPQFRTKTTTTTF